MLARGADGPERLLYEVAAALHGLSKARAIATLQSLTRHSQPLIREVALRSLMATNASERFETLDRFLGDRSPACRKAALNLLADIQTQDGSDGEAEVLPTIEESVAAILPLTADSEFSVARTALTVLGTIAQRSATRQPAAIAAIEQLTRASYRGVSERELQHMASAVLSRLSH